MMFYHLKTRRCVNTDSKVIINKVKTVDTLISIFLFLKSYEKGLIIKEHKVAYRHLKVKCRAKFIKTFS